MCGRYTVFDDDDIPELMTILRHANGLGLPYSKGEIFPTNTVPVIIPDANGIAVSLMKWGYPVPAKNTSVIINARRETVCKKPAFRGDLNLRRCVIPSSGFYEWNHSGSHEKLLFRLPGEKLLCMAGIYKDEPDGSGIRGSFVMLTSDANMSMQPYHNRMPLILGSGEVRRYLTDENFAAERLTGVMPVLSCSPAV